MRPSSARATHNVSRGTRSTHQLSDDRPTFAATSQSINLKGKNQAWPDTAANFSTEGSDVHAIKSPNSLNTQYNPFKEHRSRADRPVTFNDTQSSPNITSPTGVRFKHSSTDYSPNIRSSGREQYNREHENNMLSGSLESANGTQRFSNTQPRDYVKLEKEILDLKNDIIGKMHNPKAAQQRQVNRNAARESSSSSSSSDEANKPDKTQAHRQKPSRIDVKGATKQKNDSKIKIYDEEDILVEEPEPKELVDKKLKEEERMMDKNIEGLGKALKRREKKYSDLKSKFKEMKTILKGYVNKVIDLEDALKTKEELLLNAETQIKNDQKKLLKSNDLIQELRGREEALQKSEGSAIDSSVEYKTKYLEQKEELKKLYTLLEESEEKSKQMVHRLTQENKELNTELEVITGREQTWKDKSDNRYRELEGLERELHTSKNLLERYEAERGERESQMKALREELDKVRNEKDWLERRTDENIKNKQDFESELIKIKRKSEEETKRVLEEKENELNIKKDKIKRLKEQVREYENAMGKTNEEKRITDYEIEKIVGQKANAEKDLNKTKEELKQAHKEITALKTNLDSLKSQFNETYETLRLESTRTDNTQGELKKLTKQLKIAETKLALRDKEAEKFEERTTKLNAEVKNLLEDNTRSREYIGKLEDRVGFLQMHQSEEISKVESRIEDFYREIYLLREENKMLKTTEATLSRDVEILSQERDMFKRDYKDMKHTNKALEKELRSLNRNMKEVIDERILEISHHSRGISAHLEKDAKSEALGEVHDMIKNYRQSAYKFES